MPEPVFHIRQRREFLSKEKNITHCEKRIEQLRTHMGTLRLLVKYLNKEECVTSQSKLELKRYKTRLYQYENEMRHLNRKLLHMNSR